MPIGSVDWIAEGMLGETPARPSRGGGWEFDIRNQFFHGSHPLGWIRRWSVSIDGTALALTEFEVELRGQVLPATALSTVADVWWHPRELLTVRLPAAVLPRGPVNVTLELQLSTFFFTPEIDRDDVYPTFPLALSATMNLEDAA